MPATFLQSLCRARFSPEEASPAPPGRDPAIDGLRGAAAAFVLFHHFMFFEAAWPPFLRGLFSGRAAVLLFFTLSGYVIGRANQRAWDQGSRKFYWSRRLERLAPIYVLVVVFSFLAAALLDRPGTLSGFLYHLGLLQNFEAYGPVTLKPLWINQPLWTLHFEVVYYLLFLAIWRYRPPLWPTFLLCLAPAAAAPLLPAGLKVLASYGVGFAFWLAGLALAWRKPPAPTPGSSKHPATGFPAVALLIALHAISSAAPGAIFFKTTGLDSFLLPWVNLADLALLPVCVALVGLASGAIPRLGLAGLTLCLAPAFLPILAAAASGRNLLDAYWFSPVLLCGLILVFLFLIPDHGRWLRRLAPLGAISYALYLVHLPVRELACAAFPDSSFLVWCVSLPVVFLLSWWLERRLQPRMVALWRRSG